MTMILIATASLLAAIAIKKGQEKKLTRVKVQANRK